MNGAVGQRTDGSDAQLQQCPPQIRSVVDDTAAIVAQKDDLIERQCRSEAHDDDGRVDEGQHDKAECAIEEHWEV